MVQHFKLNDGSVIPHVYLGVGNGWVSHPGEHAGDNPVVSGLLEAIRVGYRAFDTAFIYGSEADLGTAVRTCGVPRSEFRVRTKVWNDRHGDVEVALDEALERMQLDYVDEWVVHLPVSNKRGSMIEVDESISIADTWRQMEACLASGKAKTICVSNYSVKTLTELLQTAKVVPALNCAELHPYHPDHRLVAFCKEKGIHVDAYSPLAKFDSPLLKDPTIVAIAKEVGEGVSTGQVVLAWHYHRGSSVACKSSNPSRMAANLRDPVPLSAQQMKRIDAIHLEPGKLGRVNAEAYDAKSGTVFGWSLERMGWDVGFDNDFTKRSVDSVKYDEKVKEAASGRAQPAGV